MTTTGHTLARNTLGLTAYLADPEHWAREGAHAVLEAFLESLPRGWVDHLRALSTSSMDVWKLIGPAERDGLISSLISHNVLRDLRHLFWLKLFNDHGAPSLGFSYTEIDPRRAERSAVIELTLPQEHEPADLCQLALRIAHAGPVHSIVGGYTIRYDDRYKSQAFYQIYRWVSRYIGLDVQVADEMAWKTPTALPGTSWLTVIGAPLARECEIDLVALRERAWEHGVRTIPAGEGLLLQAGEAPVLGDLNRLSYPHAYAEVANTLSSSFVEAPPSFWGPFYADGHTLPWFRRFIDTTAWAERKIDLDRAG
jgi:hypothetical protein